MAKMTVDRERCKGCKLCIDVCPKKIIVICKDIRSSKGYSTAKCSDEEQCIGCGICYTVCPDCAITVEK